MQLSLAVGDRVVGSRWSPGGVSRCGLRREGMVVGVYVEGR